MVAGSHLTYLGFFFRFMLTLYASLVLSVTAMIVIGRAESFDEGVLAFSRPTDRLRAWDVLIMDVRTRRMVEVMKYGWRVAADLQWSPDGRYLAFATLGQQSDVYVVDVYSGKGRNITNDFASDRYPSWSPDGQQLAFFSTRSDGLQFDIYIVNPDGSNLRRLTYEEAGYPSWSPDGSQIVFSSRIEGDLYVINVHDGTSRKLIHTPGDDRNPIWSPDGSQIAYISFVHQDGIFGDRIFVINADGSNNQMLSPEFSAQGMPSWSPNSRYLAFIGRTPGERYDSLYLADTYNPNAPIRKLAENAYYSYTERWTMWSPDGRYLAFSARNANGLYTVEIGSGQIRELANLMIMYPVWQPRANSDGYTRITN
jgi:TolB protein